MPAGPATTTASAPVFGRAAVSACRKSGRSPNFGRSTSTICRRPTCAPICAASPRRASPAPCSRPMSAASHAKHRDAVITVARRIFGEHRRLCVIARHGRPANFLGEILRFPIGKSPARSVVEPPPAAVLAPAGPGVSVLVPRRRPCRHDAPARIKMIAPALGSSLCQIHADQREVLWQNPRAR